MTEQDKLLKTLQQQGITHPKVLKALQAIPREAFVLPSFKKEAYANVALSIDYAQTISQPYIVALMTQAVLTHPNPKKVLEIGTGSGYQTAILATLFEEVWTIERIPELYATAKPRLQQLGITNVHFRMGDGSLGWPDAAPFDAIIVTAAAISVPPALMAQLSTSGVIIIPLGKQHEIQVLTLLQKKGNLVESTALEQVSFVPLISSGYNNE